jgi:hypothetical protein
MEGSGNGGVGTTGEELRKTVGGGVSRLSVSAPPRACIAGSCMGVAYMP